MKKLTQWHSFVYLLGAVCGDGREDGERGMSKMQAGGNAWRTVEGVMANWRISKKLKSKVMSTCLTPPCLYGTETMTLTELYNNKGCNSAKTTGNEHYQE